VADFPVPRAPAPFPPAVERPWERLDPALGAVLEPELPAMADEIIAEIARAIPEYRRPMEGAFGRGLRVGVQEALRQFLGLVGRPGRQISSGREVYRELGRGELRAGRRLDALQAAYRLGARIAWRRVSAAARSAGADAAAVSLLAESIFAYIDEISAQSVEGYAQAQAAAAGEQQRRRERLVRLVISEERPEDEVVQAAAADAGWPLPRRLAALALIDDDVQRLVGRLGPDAIGGRAGEVTCVLIADADAPGRAELLDAAVPAGPAALGPTVSAPEAHVSFTRAREGLRLQQRGVLPGGLVTVADHLGTLLLFRDPQLLDDLARRRLEPLAALGVAARARLEQTLLAWVRYQGSVPAIAEALHVHRQTVRYRLARLRELFGSDLDDPDRRFELELALRSTTGPTPSGLSPIQAGPTPSGLSGGPQTDGPVSDGDPAAALPQVGIP
jgi:hypothetical protein